MEAVLLGLGAALALLLLAPSPPTVQASFWGAVSGIGGGFGGRSSTSRSAGGSSSDSGSPRRRSC